MSTFYNANELNYLLERIHQLFQNDDIELTDEQIINVITVYDKLYSFMKESRLVSKDIAKERYNFVFNKENVITEEDNYEIFKLLIELSSKRGFFLLDYSMLLAKIKSNFFDGHCSSNPEKLSLLLELYLTFFDEGNDLEDQYIQYHDKCLDDIVKEHYNDILESDIIDENEKNVITKFVELYIHDELFNNYHDYFIQLVNVSWAYLVVNNKIIYEYNKVMDYLETIYDHFDEVLFKMVNSDIYEGSELLNFIKTLYEDKSKILNLKQIN